MRVASHTKERSRVIQNKTQFGAGILAQEPVGPKTNLTNSDRTAPDKKKSENLTPTRTEWCTDQAVHGSLAWRILRSIQKAIMTTQ